MRNGCMLLLSTSIKEACALVAPLATSLLFDKTPSAVKCSYTDINFVFLSLLTDLKLIYTVLDNLLAGLDLVVG